MIDSLTRQEQNERAVAFCHSQFIFVTTAGLIAFIAGFVVENAF